MATKSDIHSRLIAQAAKQTLSPVGLAQKGRSRVWLGDRGWCLDVVEFQPSGFSKGSYLNVACMWFWNVKDYISFDFGDRVEGLRSFENEEQFAPIAEMLVEKARDEIIRLRRQIPTIQALSDFHLDNPASGFWPVFNSAIAHALSGRNALGIKLMQSTFGILDLTIERQKRAHTDAQTLAVTMQDAEGFRKLISNRIRKCRMIQRLPLIDGNLSASST